MTIENFTHLTVRGIQFLLKDAAREAELRSELDFPPYTLACDWNFNATDTWLHPTQFRFLGQSFASGMVDYPSTFEQLTCPACLVLRDLALILSRPFDKAPRPRPETAHQLGKS
jgi:hypothetical protein